MNNQPKLWLTSMSSETATENYIEMIEPILPYLSGIIWSLNDVPIDAPAARYLESVKGNGKIIYRNWSRGRHHHCMNDTLYCGPMEEGDSFYLWSDLLERPAREFVSRIKTEIIPMMYEADVDVIFYFGKAYLVRYRETLEYRNSPHWSLHGWNGRGIEWNTIEPNERLVRLNVRPEKRKNEPYHWITHYLKYMLYPAGCNHAALGIENYAKPGEDLNHAFARREAARLEFRREVRRRGYPVTVDGVRSMLLNENELDDKMIVMLNGEKTLSDFYHFLHGCNDQLKDTHRPSDALPVN